GLVRRGRRVRGGEEPADGVRVRPEVVIIAPLPPPYQGVSIFTGKLLGCEVLGAAYEVLHLDTAAPRSGENKGRVDLTSVVLALRHAAGLVRRLERERPDLVSGAVAQNAWAYVRDGVFS